MLSEEAEIQFAKCLCIQAAAAVAAPSRTGMCMNIAVFSLYFLTALQGKGCCGALYGGGPVASTSPQSPGGSWPQYKTYSASTKLITSVSVPALKKTSILSHLFNLPILYILCPSFTSVWDRLSTSTPSIHFITFLPIYKEEEREEMLLCNLLFKDLRGVRGHTSRTNKNLMWLFVTYCCMFPDITWAHPLSLRSRKTKSSGAIPVAPFFWAYVNSLCSIFSSMVLFHHS